MGQKASMEQEVHEVCDRKHWEFNQNIQQGNSATMGAQEWKDMPVCGRILGAINKMAYDQTLAVT